MTRIFHWWPRYDPDPEDMEGEFGPQMSDCEDIDEEDREDVLNNWREEWIGYSKRVILPDAVSFNPNDCVSPPPFSLREHVGKDGRPLQVIVKLANIHLTPEKPDYEGGTWHVEGKLVRWLA
jgi:Protein of unknown function (DUF4246)